MRGSYVSWKSVYVPTQSVALRRLKSLMERAGISTLSRLGEEKRGGKAQLNERTVGEEVMEEGRRF